mmetsp:Transcript_2676/g.5093  ORF Transcript_2676/g.5093 Transcript_2676/m.5093 type:complete len:97 (-) Transcript_2676:267-557(-)
MYLRWNFPFFTFAANILGSTISTGVDAGVYNGCSSNYEFAVVSGLCGALSTVSTFIGEAHKLAEKRPDGWFFLRYVWTTILVAQVIVVILLAELVY